MHKNVIKPFPQAPLRLTSECHTTAISPENEPGIFPHVFYISHSHMLYCSSSFTQGYQSQEHFRAQQPLKGKMPPNLHEKHETRGSFLLRGPEYEDTIARADFNGDRSKARRSTRLGQTSLVIFTTPSLKSPQTKKCVYADGTSRMCLNWAGREKNEKSQESNMESLEGSEEGWRRRSIRIRR